MTAADGRARIIGVEHVDVQEHPDADHPYVLTTGRVGDDHDGSRSRRTRRHSERRRPGTQT